MTYIFLMIGTTELIIVAAVALLFFGGKKLPEMMKGLGQGVRNFKEGMSEPPIKTMENDKKEAIVETQEENQHKEVSEDSSIDAD